MENAVGTRPHTPNTALSDWLGVSPKMDSVAGLSVAGEGYRTSPDD